MSQNHDFLTFKLFLPGMHVHITSFTSLLYGTFEEWFINFFSFIVSGVNKHQHPSLFCGLWVLAGMLAFVIVEKVFSNLQEPLETQLKPKVVVRYSKANGFKNHGCDHDKQIGVVNGKREMSEYCTNNNKHDQVTEVKEHYHISGYLNLMANSIDNFTHGLAIGGSFCISFKIGVLSTFAILVHEIPHEVGDFAILLK